MAAEMSVPFNPEIPDPLKRVLVSLADDTPGVVAFWYHPHWPNIRAIYDAWYLSHGPTGPPEGVVVAQFIVGDKSWPSGGNKWHYYRRTRGRLWSRTERPPGAVEPPS